MDALELSCKYILIYTIIQKFWVVQLLNVCEKKYFMLTIYLIKNIVKTVILWNEEFRCKSL